MGLVVDYIVIDIARTETTHFDIITGENKMAEWNKDQRDKIVLAIEAAAYPFGDLCKWAGIYLKNLYEKSK